MGNAKKKRPHQVRVAMRKNRTTRERRPDMAHYLRNPEAVETELTESESIQPKGAMSRHRTVDVSRLHWYELEADPHSQEQTGMVLRMFGAFAQVESEQGAVLCSLRRLLRTVQTVERGAVVVGDRVTFRLAKSPQVGQASCLSSQPAEPASSSVQKTDRQNTDPTTSPLMSDLPQGVIERVLPRGGELCRLAKGKWHTLAANVDQLLIITSCALPPMSTHLIDRYLVTAEAGRLKPVIILNKCDLEPENRPAAGALPKLHEIYDPLQVPVLAASAKTGQGVDDFRQLLTGKRSAIAGQSGVGKSSLLNTAYPGLKLSVSEVSEFWQHGRHTTTTAKLIPLPEGIASGFVVDTPGVRQLGLWGLPIRDLAAYFPDVTLFSARCRFHNCTHRRETGCAVRTAAEQGELHPSRYESYLRMIAEAK